MDDRPKLNKQARNSLVSGILVILVFSTNLLIREGLGALITCLPVALLSLFAITYGIEAMGEVRGIEGRERDYKYALLGIALGAIAPLLVIVWWYFFAEATTL